MKIIIAIVVVALLILYLFLSGRKLWRAVNAAMTLLASIGTRLSEPLGKYPALPVDPPLASPFEPQRRVAAWQDLQRVNGVRRELRRSRLSRSMDRWETIDPEMEPYVRLNRQTAKKTWEQRRSVRFESSASNTQR